MWEDCRAEKGNHYATLWDVNSAVQGLILSRNKSGRR